MPTVHAANILRRFVRGLDDQIREMPATVRAMVQRLQHD